MRLGKHGPHAEILRWRITAPGHSASVFFIFASVLAAREQPKPAEVNLLGRDRHFSFIFSRLYP